MNISQLETLVTISKTLSFRKAGEVLNLTQPAVSAQIKSLEDEFKAILVDRNHPVALTDRGQVFLDHAEQILTIVEQLKQKLTDLNQVPQGSHRARNNLLHRDSDFAPRPVLFSEPVSAH